MESPPTIKQNVSASDIRRRNSQLDIVMLSFRHSQPIYSLYPASGGSKCSPYSFYDPHSSSSQPVADPEARYCRALTEYLTAEEEYKALLRAREEAKLRARVEDALRRQERARLLRAEIARARREQQVQQLEEALAAALSRDIAPYLCAHVARADDAGVEKESPESPLDSSTGRSSAEDEVCGLFDFFGHDSDYIISLSLSTKQRKTRGTANHHFSTPSRMSPPYPVWSLFSENVYRR